MSADELRFGTLAPKPKSQNASFDSTALTMQDRAMLAKYVTLSVADRKAGCDVVVVAAVNPKIYEK